MSVDPSAFIAVNVTDTCSVWNLLSSRLLFARAVLSRCHFCCTNFVQYECLYKTRKSYSPEERELRARLQREQAQGQFRPVSIEIADLQQVATMQTVRRVSFGELSSIAFAKRTGQAFLTDDQKARTVAHENLASQHVQTTPHLFGWLVFTGVLSDGDVEQVIAEHSAMKRPLGRYFKEMRERAAERRLALTFVKKEPPPS